MMRVRGGGGSPKISTKISSFSFEERNKIEKIHHNIPQYTVYTIYYIAESSKRKREEKKGNSNRKEQRG
jgi:hypothetical protein